ncbi:MAG: fumarate/nitrate reduction transcriptional regulator Fnr [Zhongshania sp.]|uniref:fumarate/nitrate reduction transcriptional regulator Fnr n=1 Tax=Zhongshania sp. TaxID=1971902 RepID=UPI002620AB11|nr:fumarate/nitrate reduction transcriptional regulator Fnr [Zhongshania sp.]MDF1691705.1 fumarate/nitrate reduction transcriptional regulator Fnr [Zhongshania sp.]
MIAVSEPNAPSNKNCPHNAAINCTSCRLSAICLPLALAQDEIVQLDEIVQRGRPLQKGQHLYRENDTFTSIFAVRSGAVKAYSVSDSGEEQVTGFYLPGEILGMDGIGHNRYASSALAMEVSAICEIPFANIEDLSGKLPNMQKHFFKLLSQEIVEDQRHITLVSKHTAEERLASLIVSISARNARRNLSPLKFRLPMSRTDIGNFLGLTIETVSRVFGRFAKQGLIEINKKELTVLDIEALKHIAALGH